MKLYISYYGNYISVVEGMYNHKKSKYILKNVQFISTEDVDIDYEDKYSLLKEALKLINSKTKNVVLCLNTRDVIIKTNSVVKVSPKDLEGLMKNEIYEMMSLDNEKYTFSYEVTKENLENNTLDVITAAILNSELDIITNIFKENKLNLECIDTISTSYNRLLKNVTYENIMMLNLGRYGSLVNIYMNDSLFIHDNIPVRITDESNFSVCLALIEELTALMNFYSSRNYGKSIDKIVLIGEQNNNQEVVNAFKDRINTEIVYAIEDLQGIECLFDIEQHPKSNLNNCEVSKICDVLGSMLIRSSRKDFNTMNLLPESVIKKQINKRNLKRAVNILPIVIGILCLPYIVLNMINNDINEVIYLEQSNLSNIEQEYKGIEDIENRIKSLEDEISIYDSLDSKSINWGSILSQIDRNIPYTVDLNNIEIYYQEKELNTKDQSETPIYDQIPNILVIEGIASDSYRIGQFVYSLTHISSFEKVELKNSTLNEETGGYDFNIVATLKEGEVLSEQQ